MSHRWDSAAEWLRARIVIADEAVLRGIAFALLSLVNNDQIQDVFQNELAATGFFDEVADG